METCKTKVGLTQRAVFYLAENGMAEKAPECIRLHSSDPGLILWTCW